MTDFDDIRSTPGLTASQILYTAGATILINAPASHVFNTILSFDNYGLWNTDTPKMVRTAPSSPLTKGSTLNMQVVMTAQNKTYDIPVEILRVEQPSDEGVYVLAWRGKMLPGWFGVSERVQEVRDVGDGKCEVTNWESMGGMGAYLFKYVMGVPAQMKGFNRRYLEDLKGRAEGTGK